MTSATTRDSAPASPYALSSSKLISAAGVGSMTMPIRRSPGLPGWRAP